MGPSRRDLLAGLAIAVAGQAMAQEQPKRGQERAEIIDDPRVSHFDIGPKDKLWRIFVGLPKAPPPPAGYSAIVSVDGNATFPLLWRHREAVAPDAPIVLIGVGYVIATRMDRSRRWYDLTSAALPGQIPARFRAQQHIETGGNTAFLRLITDRVLPEVAKNAPLDRSKMTLFGHSLGGLFTLNALFTRPESFANYVAGDPSVWWKQGEAIDQAIAFAGGIHAAGEKVAPPLNLLLSRSGIVTDAHTSSPLADLPQLVETLHGIEGLSVTYRTHPEETHGSLMNVSAQEAVELHAGLYRDHI